MGLLVCEADLSLLLPDLELTCDFGEGGIDEVASGGVSRTRDGDFELDLAGELCLLSRLLERDELFSGLGEALTHFGDIPVDVLRLLTTVVGLTDRCLFLLKKRLSLGVLCAFVASTLPSTGRSINETGT